MTPHIRWMIHRDYPEVLEIERQSFDHPWTERDYTRRLLGKDGLNGLVAEAGVPGDKWTPILGFLVYALNKGHLELVRLAIHPSHRRAGVGRRLLHHLEKQLKDGGRRAVVFAVPDTRLDAHLWLKSCGYRVNDPIIRGQGGERDRYRFTYRLPAFTPEAATGAILAPTHDPEWSSSHWRERAIHLSRVRFGTGLQPESLVDAVRSARPLARCLPDPLAYRDAQGRPRLVWSRRGRSVVLVANACWGAVVEVTPRPAPPHIYDGRGSAEVLARALDWAFGTGAPAPAAPGEEDRSC